MARGKFIVIEGTDGSGKTEQFKRLFARLPKELSAKTIDFPRYEEPSSYFVSEMLHGRYGALEDIPPRQASLFYALDRFDASMKKMKQWITDGETILANRYVGSSMGHQAAKIGEKKDRIAFFEWLYDLEYGICGIPKPDLNIILHVPAEISQELLQKKGDRAYLKGKTKDIAEENLAHQKKAEKAYLEIAELFPDDFTVIECAPGGTLLSIDEVHEKLWAVARKTLAL